MRNKSIEDKILESTKKRGRGTFIFPSEFVRYGEHGFVGTVI